MERLSAGWIELLAADSSAVSNRDATHPAEPSRYSAWKRDHSRRAPHTTRLHHVQRLGTTTHLALADGRAVPNRHTAHGIQRGGGKTDVLRRAPCPTRLGEDDAAAVV